MGNMMNKLKQPVVLLLCQGLIGFPVAVIINALLEYHITFFYLLMWVLMGVFSFITCSLLKKVPFFLVRLFVVAIAIGLGFIIREGNVIINVAWVALAALLPTIERNTLIHQPLAIINICLTLGYIIYFIIGLSLFFISTAVNVKLITIGAIGFTMLILFFLNYYKLEYTTHRVSERYILSKTIVVKNRVMVAITASIVLALAFIKQLQSLILQISNVIKNIIRVIIEFLMFLIPVIEVPLQQRQTEELPIDTVPQSEVHWIWQIIEIIKDIITILIIVAITIWIGKKLCNYLYKWIQQVLKMVANIELKNTSMTYTEEQKSTFDVERLKAKIKRPFKRKFKYSFKQSWQQSKNLKEQMRVLFQYYLYCYHKKGGELLPHQTEQEIINNDHYTDMNQVEKHRLVALYERAMYSNERMDEQDIIEIKKEVERL